MRFLGIKDNRIFFVTETLVESDEFEIIKVPDELFHLSPKEIIMSCRFENNRIMYKYPGKSAKDLKIALVGNWKTKCGIATYSENLWPEIAKHVGDFKLFIEKNNINTGNIYEFGDCLLQDSKVSACWQRGESLQNLVKEIKKYDPDIILIQHEFGLWSNARYWLSMMTGLSDYRVIVTMHSVFPEHQDKILYEASMSEIIVHLDGAQHNLKNEKKINAKVHVIPHGCYKIGIQNKLWNNYKSSHTFVQQGFGFHYKNFESSIKATAILKKKYDDIFFTALFSESPFVKTDHQIYYNELSRLIEELELQENVAIIRGFQPDNIVDCYLRSNQIAVFPYLSIPGHEVFGASGAARLAMAAGVPIISSSISHFSDLPTIKANNPEQISEELNKLFCSEQLKKQQIEKQNQFINNNSWEKIAKLYINVMES